MLIALTGVTVVEEPSYAMDLRSDTHLRLQKSTVWCHDPTCLLDMYVTTSSILVSSSSISSHRRRCDVTDGSVTPVCTTARETTPLTSTMGVSRPSSSTTRRRARLLPRPSSSRSPSPSSPSCRSTVSTVVCVTFSFLMYILNTHSCTVSVCV